MENNNTISVVQCPKCGSLNVTSTNSVINKNTGLKTGKGSLFWGLIMAIAGAFFIILGISNWNLPEAKPGLILGVGILLLLNGIFMIAKFILRENENYVHYRCKDCSHKWNRLGGEGNIQVIKPFLDALRNDDIAKKKNTLNIIANIHDSRFIDPVRANLNNTNSEIRTLAFSAVCAYKAVTLDECINATKDQEKQIRDIAVGALKNFTDDKATEHLILALDDKSINVRAQAMISLKKQTGKNMANESKWKAWWEEKQLGK